MKKILKKWWILLVCAVMTVAGLSIAVAASGNNDTPSGNDDAAKTIYDNLSAYRQGNTVELADDGYLGVPCALTVYYDYAVQGAATPGLDGTQVILYVVNANVERIGTKSDVEIITGMLNRGYAVVVLDYKHNASSDSYGVEYSAKALANQVKAGTYFSDKTVFPKGSYRQMNILPAGYDISPQMTFWEIDKHSAAGTIEKIVDNWNTDFRGWFGNTVIYWAYEDGTRKPTQNAFDGSSPVWLNASGTTDANGKYIKIKYTKAETIADCVKKDGSPISLDLGMTVVYPTNPENAVPVMILEDCYGDLTGGDTGTDTLPHMTSFLFSGYAGVFYDYLWMPMARDDHYGYYDGRTEYGGKTGDQMNYSVQIYNDKRVNTAAMRYVRYLALSESETYAFDIDALGVYGYSKAGWAAFLGEEILLESTVEDPSLYTTEELETLIDTKINSFDSKRTFTNHHNETRYQAGDTADQTIHGITIDGGEKQPWLTYDGEEILSGVNFQYESCGASEEDISEGHCPMLVSIHLADIYGIYNGATNRFADDCKSMDIPALVTIVDIAHALTYSPDVYHDFDSFEAWHKFADYYLKHTAVSVCYSDPASGVTEISPDEDIVFQFYGTVLQSAIDTVTVKNGDGETANGKWTSYYGGAQWIFTPYDFAAGETYTFTFPETFSGDNGKAIGKAETFTFTMQSGREISAVSLGSQGNASSFKITVPEDIGDASEALFRFTVTNDAANLANVYAQTSGGVRTLVDSIPLTGAGTYLADMTNYLSAKTAGEEITVTVEAGRSVGTFDRYSKTFSSTAEWTVSGNATGTVTNISGVGSALKILPKSNSRYNYGDIFYDTITTVCWSSKVLNGGLAFGEQDMGRTFTFTVRIYDETSRRISLYLNSASNKDTGAMDLSMPVHNFITEPGMNEYTFTYTPYESEYGLKALNAVKTFTLGMAPTGDTQIPLYLVSFTTTETVTGITLDAALSSLVLLDGGVAVKAPDAQRIFEIVNSDSTVYADTLSEAFGLAKAGAVVRLHANYAASASDTGIRVAGFDSLTLDLNGYRLTADGLTSSLFTLNAESKTDASFLLQNGLIRLGHAPLVNYSGSATGTGKKISVQLNGVTLTAQKGSMLTEVMSASTLSGTSGVEVTFRLIDSVISLRHRDMAKVWSTLLPSGSANVSIFYVFSGGVIDVDSFDYITFTNNYKHAEVISQANETLLRYGAYEALPEVNVLYGTTAASFSNAQADGGFVNYSLAVNPNWTKYGIIPEAYADAQQYPFVLFNSNEEFVGATDLWEGSQDSSSAISKAIDAILSNKWNGANYGDNPLSVIVLLRRDYQIGDGEWHANLAQVKGVMTLDLDGHTLTRLGYSPVFEACAKGLGSEMCATTVNVVNGSIVTKKCAVISANCWDSNGDGSIVKKAFNFNFTDVTFRLEAGAETADWLVNFDKSSDSSKDAPFTFTFTDCIFDATAARSKTATLFNAASSNNNHTLVKMQVNGCEIYADGLNALTFYRQNTAGKDTVKFAPNANGSYLTLTVPTGVTPTGTFPTAEGTFVFEESSESGANTVWTLVQGEEEEEDEIGALTRNKEYNILFIGNSFTWTNSLNVIVKNIAEAAGYTVTTTAFSGQGTALELYADPTTALGKKFYTALAQNDYDFVVMQCNPTFPGREHARFYDSVRILAEAIRADGATPILYSTWGHKDGESAMTGLGWTNETMTWKLAASYQAIGDELGIKVAHAGVAMREVYTGTSGIELYLEDNYHPSLAASYMAAATLYGTIFNRDPALISYCESNVTAAQKTVLLTAAHNVVKGTVEIPASYRQSSEDVTAIGEGKQTNYGVIPKAYVNPQLYPFVAFDANGEFLFASSMLYGAQDNNSIITLAKIYLESNVWNGTDYGTSEKKVTILMCRDYEIASNEWHANLGQYRGECTIDLGGFTLSRTESSSHIFEACAKGVGKQFFPTTFKIKNGTIMTNKGTIISANSWDSVGDKTSISAKTFTFDFYNVNFVLASGATTENWLISYVNASTLESNRPMFNVNLRDCMLDMTGSAASNLKLFNAAPTDKSMVNATFNVAGCHIFANNTSNLTLFCEDTSKNSRVNFITNYEGKYLSFDLPEGINPPSYAVKSSGGELLTLTEGITSSGTTVWTYKGSGSTSSEGVTDYGTIPETYASTQDYPFVAFDGKGNFLFASSLFYGAQDDASIITKAKIYLESNVWDGTSYGSNAKKVIILMRRDYAFGSGEWHANLAHIKNECTVDLGGYTMTNPWFEATAKEGADGVYFPTTLKFKNGTIVSNGYLIVGSSWDSKGDKTSISAKNFIFDFTNVNFVIPSGSTAWTWLITYNNSSTQDSNRPMFYVNLTDCTYDMTNYAGNSIILFNAAPWQEATVDMTVNVYGGKVICADTAKLNLYQGNVNFRKNGSGKYLSLVLPEAASAPSYSVKSADGNTLTLKKGTVAEGQATWTYEETFSEAVTAYGTIPAEYSSAMNYPFVGFDGNGNFLFASSMLYGAQDNKSIISLAKFYLESNVWNGTSFNAGAKTVIILMRRNYEIASNEWHANLAQFKGECTIDLGGFTLSRTESSSHIFEACAKAFGKEFFPTTFKIKNGTIMTNKGTIIYANSWDSVGDKTSISAKTFTFDFTNVNFVLAENATASNWLISYKDASTLESNRPMFYVNLTDCTFDMTGYAGNSVKLFNAVATQKSMVDATFNVKGGTVITSDPSKLDLYAENTEANCKVNFKKNGSDEYIKFVLPESQDVLTLTVKLDDGKIYCFTKGETAWSATLLKLDGFKQNVAFYSNFKTNLYIPKTSDKIVTGVTYEGTPLTLGERVIDDKTYYVATVEVGAEEANEKIALAITFTFGGNTYTQTVSTNIVAYAQALAKISAYENLANAMLYYAKCAAPNANITATRVEATKAAAVNTMAQGTPVTGASVAIASAPVFTFALDNTYTGVIRFTWKSGEQTVTVDKTVECDASVTLNELKLYDFTETITVSYKNGDAFTEVGQYNLAAYAASDAGLQNADLVNALYDYAEQAKAYIFAK